MCIDNAIINDYEVVGYCEVKAKPVNPFNLTYLGKEGDLKRKGISFKAFVGIGNNSFREAVMTKNKSLHFINLIHPSAKISPSATISKNSNVLINAGVIVNSLAKIGRGVILNTASIIEHECEIGDFVHIAPGAVLAGNVSIGKNSFVGANAVIRQGLNIGKNVVIGAGSVVIRDVPNGELIAGNPAKTLAKK